MTTTTSFSYRAHRPTVDARLRERLAQLRAESEQPAVRERLAIHRRRVARTVAGTVGAAGGLAMLVVGAVTLVLGRHQILGVYAFATALIAMPVSYLIAAALAPIVERRHMARLMARSGDPAMDLAIVERASARTVASVWAERWERASLTMPLVAVALLGPLALHAITFVGDPDARSLAIWIGLSAAIVGHAHLAFAGLAVRYVNELRDGILSTHPALRIWGWVILVSAVPGLIFLALPPILTAVTGVFLVYPMCKWAEVTMQRERLALSS